MAFTARQVWEGMLTELSKVNAPSLLLHEFNYYFNKAINLYINKHYNSYDVNLQSTDDLRVLKATAMLTPEIVNNYSINNHNLFGATYEISLPLDYLHMLNCVCIYKMLKTHKCYDKGDYVEFAAKRLTADSWSLIINDYYNRPLPERPYFYIHNINTSELIPTNPVPVELSNDAPVPLTKDFKGTDVYSPYNVQLSESDYVKVLKITKDNSSEIYLVDNPQNPTATDLEKVKEICKENVEIKSLKKTDLEPYIDKNKGEVLEWIYGSPKITSNLPRTIKINRPDNNVDDVSTVEREAAVRYGNASAVRCEIRYGKDNSVYHLEKVFVDYIKAPQTIRLTKELVDLTEDTSQIMEFPDYVCQEIINELVVLVMLRDGDPRIQTQQAVSLSIANPVQQLAAQSQQRG